MARLLVFLLSLVLWTGAATLAQEQVAEDRQKLEAQVKQLLEEGMKFYRAAQYPAAEEKFQAALALRRRQFPPNAFPDGHLDLATTINDLAFVCHLQGKLAQAEPLYRETLAMRQRLYPPERFPQGHPRLASSLNNLAELLQDKGDLRGAETMCREVLAMRQRLYPAAQFPQGHVEVAESLNNLAALLQAQGRLTAAEALSREALAMFRQLYPPQKYPRGHAALASSLNNLAEMLRSQGQLLEAEPFLREALTMREQMYPRDQFPRGHPEVARSLNSMGSLLQDQGKLAAAEPFYRDALAMRQQLFPLAQYPQGHPELARSLNNLATLWHDLGKRSEAETLYRETVAMYRRMFPPDRFPAGHPTLARGLNNLALLLEEQEQFAEAEKHAREAVTMYRRLFPPQEYPHGHPLLATTLNNLASLLQSQGQLADAEALHQEALTLRRQLYPAAQYPQGHGDIGASLNNLAYTLQAQGKYAQAEALYREALTLHRQLYAPARAPLGHARLVQSLSNLSGICREQGKRAEAVVLAREALVMHRQLLLEHAQVRGEGEVLTLLATCPLLQDAYLSLLRQQPDLAPPGYATLWAHRALLTRLAEQQHLDRRAAALAPQTRHRWEELRRLRRRRAQLLLASVPTDPETRQNQERQLQDADQTILTLTAQLRESWPAWRTLQSMDECTPAELQYALQPGTVFVDLVRYHDFVFDPAQPGFARMKRTPCYMAFILTRDHLRMVDFGPAAPLEAAVQSWRGALIRPEAPLPDQAPAMLRTLLWEPLERQFPPGTNTVFLCPDQTLCFLPWVALPGKQPGRVLLEEYSLAVVPHGRYLLRHLTSTPEQTRKEADVLLLGGVQYDEAAVPVVPGQQQAMARPGPGATPERGWKYLPGTTAEAEALHRLAQRQQLQVRVLSGVQAETQRLCELLPQVRFAHLATHGFFADATFRSVFQMNEKHFAMRGNERIGKGALLPSVLSGLVLAGANRPETPGRGILTAEELTDLDLTGMELVVLSACETGLGEVAGGEGVFGLQRAFHLAGCKNVVASLWKVHDVATLVLMEEFYRNVWEKKLPKREALRQAQLTLYRQPELVLQRRQQLRTALLQAGVPREELAQRGFEEEAMPLPAVQPGAGRRSPPAWWAAFQWSGLGD